MTLIVPLLSTTDCCTGYAGQVDDLRHSILRIGGRADPLPHRGYRTTHTIGDLLAFILVNQRLIYKGIVLLVIFIRNLHGNCFPIGIVIIGGTHKIALNLKEVALIDVSLIGVVHLPVQCHKAILFKFRRQSSRMV